MDGLFNVPPPKDTTLGKVGRFLAGFGAGYQGRGADILAQQDQMQQQLDERRKKAMAQDAMRVYSQLNDGKYDDAIELIDDRVKAINELGGDASDTLEIRNLIVSGRLDEAQQELGGFLELAMQNGLIEAPKAPEAYTLSPGQVRFEGGRQVAQVAAAPTAQEPLTTAGKLRADLAAGRITQGDFDAEMARINQPTTQAQPAPLTEIGRVRRAVDLGELTPEEGDQLINFAITEQESKAGQAVAKTEDDAQQQALVEMETKRIYDLTNNLLGNADGLSGATGPVSSRIPSFRQSTVDFEADLAELQNLLTMTNLGRMTGVLSQSDIELIRNAASGISERGSEQRMRSKLLEIQTRILPKLIDAGILSADGSAPAGNVPPIPSQYQGMINDAEWQAMTPEERAAF